MAALLPTTARAAATFTGVSSPIPPAVEARMRAGTWREDHPRCPRLDQLAYVELDHWTLDGDVARGELVVAAAIARPTLTLLRRLFALGFPIARMRLLDDYGDDPRSMAADNSSAFCFRVIDGTTDLSWHALGMAIDLNPVENPWVRPGHGFVPAEGAPYLERTDVRPGMIVRPGPVVRVFDELGWEWGGDWRHSLDHHHIVWAARG